MENFGLKFFVKKLEKCKLKSSDLTSNSYTKEQDQLLFYKKKY